MIFIVKARMWNFRYACGYLSMLGDGTTKEMAWRHMPTAKHKEQLAWLPAIVKLLWLNYNRYIMERRRQQH